MIVLSRKLRNEYLKRAAEEFIQLTGLKADKLTFEYEHTKVASPMILNVQLDRYVAASTVIKIRVSDPCFYSKLDLYTADPIVAENYSFTLITNEQFKILFDLVNGTVKLNAVEEWNTLLHNKLIKLQKSADNKKSLAKMQLDFDGCITWDEIRDLYCKNFYVKHHKTKITLHRYAPAGRYYVRPVHTFKIKSVYFDNDTFNYVFNRKEFESLPKPDLL